MPGKKKTVSRWRPASMGATKRSNAKILGVRQNDLFWGAGGAAASLVTSYIAQSLFYPLDMPTLNPTLVGSLVAAAAGYGILASTKGYKREAMPWVVGSLIPMAAKTAYDFFFVTPPPAQEPVPETP